MMTAFMDILKRDIIERDNSYKRIKNFLNKRKERRPLEKVKQFIKNELSGHYMYKINDVGKLENIYSLDYSRYVIHLYFPKDNVVIIMSQQYADKLYYTRSIMTNTFNDTFLRINYYNKSLNSIMIGPKLIISMVELKSIIMNNNRVLKELINERYKENKALQMKNATNRHFY